MTSGVQVHDSAPEPRTRDRRPPSGRPSPRARRRGLGQDARAHRPYRAPHPRARRGSVPHLRRDLHEQGRRRNAGPRGHIARGRPARSLDRDVSLSLGTPAAARSAAPGLRAQLHDLRSGRLGVVHQAHAGAARPRAQDASSTRDPRDHLGRQEPYASARGAGRERRRPAGACRRRDLRRARPRVATGQRDGLRRSPVVPPHVVRGAPGAPRVLAAPLRSRPGGRIPGHERRPVPPRKASGRRAPEPLRRRRRRPGDLRLARRRRPAHAVVSAGLSGDHPHQARAELPLDPGDPGRRKRRHCGERPPLGEDAIHCPARWRTRDAAHRRRRAGRSRVARRGAVPPCVRSRPGVPGDGDPVPHQRPVASLRGGVAVSGDSVSAGRGGELL